MGRGKNTKMTQSNPETLTVRKTVQKELFCPSWLLVEDGTTSAQGKFEERKLERDDKVAVGRDEAEVP